MINNYSIINQYFDQVYVLNLEKRPDRKLAMLQKLSRLGIKAEFVEAINGYSSQNITEHNNYLEQPIGVVGSHQMEIEYQRKLIKSPGAWGYLKTYLGILQDAKKRGFERILCFDDDVLFHNDFENRFQSAIQDIPPDWKLLYLGASQYVWKIPQGLSYREEKKTELDSAEPFYHPCNTDGSFAMGIHASAFDILISDILKMNCPFDSGALRTVIQAHPKKCFVFNPNIVVADVSESDIREGQEQQKLADRLKWNMADYDFPFRGDLVSVIMPAFNAEKTIEKSIRSILMQSYKSLELIIVDDASTDSTARISQKLKEEDSRISVISLPENKGVGGARNEGVKASKGDIIAIQDADDISLKDRLARQLIPIYEKGVQFTLCRFYRSRCTIDELDIDDQDATIALVKSRRINTESGIYDYRDRAAVGLVTTVLRRQVFEKYGLFDEHRFGEDMEFVERILYYNLGQKFSKDYNGHSFLTEQKSIAKLYELMDLAMYLSPEMVESNLTIQYQKETKNNELNQKVYREKYRQGGLDQFSKLPIKNREHNSLNLSYNTLRLNNFMILPEIEYNRLLEYIEALKSNEVTKLDPSLDKIYNSLSWRITAPLRWGLSVIKQITGVSE